MERGWVSFTPRALYTWGKTRWAPGSFRRRHWREVTQHPFQESNCDRPVRTPPLGGLVFYETCLQIYTSRLNVNSLWCGSDVHISQTVLKIWRELCTDVITSYTGEHIVCAPDRLRPAWPGFDSQQEQGRNFFPVFFTTFRPVLRPTQPPKQWVTGALSLGIKRPEREAYHILPCNAEFKNAWSYTFTPLTSSWSGTLSCIY
jgi:hypothetical protein